MSLVTKTNVFITTGPLRQFMPFPTRSDNQNSASLMREVFPCSFLDATSMVLLADAMVDPLLRLHRGILALTNELIATNRMPFTDSRDIT